MGKTYRSSDNSDYNDGYSKKKPDKSKVKKIRQFLDNKKVDKRTEYPLAGNKDESDSDY